MKQKLSCFLTVVTLLVAGTGLPGFALVLNVRDFGALGNGISNDTAAVHAAITNMNDIGPGVIYFPPGEYLVTYWAVADITIDGVWVRGDGDASVLRRSPPVGGAGVIRAPGVKGLIVSDLAFDLDVQPGENFCTAINCSGIENGVPPASDNVRVINCLFYSSTNILPMSVVGGDPTIHAILSQNSESVWVQGCRSVQMQFKMAGEGPSGPGVFVLDNYFEEPFNAAVSWVGNNFTNDVRYRGARLSGNIINGIGGSTGFHLGSDGEGSLFFTNVVSGLFQGLQVCNNQIIGNWDATSTGINANGGIHAEDYIIADNILRNEGYIPEVHSDTFGIVARHWASTTDRPTVLQDCLIMGNRIENMGSQGISTSANNVQILYNHVSHTRGMEVYTQETGDFMTQAIVRGNTFLLNRGAGMELKAGYSCKEGEPCPQEPMSLRARVVANVFANTTDEQRAMYLSSALEATLHGDIFANEISSTLDAPPPDYGIVHRGPGTLVPGIFYLRYFDNDIWGHTATPPADGVPPGTEVRDNRGWP